MVNKYYVFQWKFMSQLPTPNEAAAQINLGNFTLSPSKVTAISFIHKLLQNPSTDQEEAKGRKDAQLGRSIYIHLCVMMMVMMVICFSVGDIDDYRLLAAEVPNFEESQAAAKRMPNVASTKRTRSDKARDQVHCLCSFCV